MSPYNVLDFGAAGDGQANDAAAIQCAIDACTAAGAGDSVWCDGSGDARGPVTRRRIPAKNRPN